MLCVSGMEGARTAVLMLMRICKNTHVHMYVHDPAYIHTFKVFFSSQAIVRQMRRVASQSYPIDLMDITNIDHACLCNFNSFKRRLFYILLSRI